MNAHGDSSPASGGRAAQFGVLFGATLLWACTPVFVKHFALAKLDPDVQNLYRYAAAALGLWVLVLARFRGEAAEAWRQWTRFLAPAAVNCVFQVSMVAALYHRTIFPTFSTLLGQSAVVFSMILAYALFHDERRTIRSGRFLAGSALAAAGGAGVILWGARAAVSGGAGDGRDFALGAGLVLLQSLLWAGYTVAMKPVVRRTRPLVAFCMVATYTTLFFIALTCVRSRPAQFLEIGFRDQFLVVFSGVAFISAAHSMYFRAVERLGVGVCSSVTLIIPLCTGLLSWAWHGERLAPLQMAMGAVLLLGVLLVMGARRLDTAAGKL